MTTDEAMRNVVSSSAATGVRKPGDFCWFNIITPRPHEACELFSALLGWSFSKMPGMRDGLTIHVGGRNIGAMWDQNAPDTPKGTPACIGVSIRVESADFTAERVCALGGTARPPFDVLDAGRMSVCTDPTGAQFDVWEAKKHAGTDVDNRIVGAPSWFEARTRDMERASAFYAGVFGWEPEVVTPPGMRYTTFKLGGRPVAGMVQCPDSMNVQPHWATFFNCDDPDAAARKAATLGAQVTMRPTDIPNIGRFCALASAQGVAFQLIKYVTIR